MDKKVYINADIGVINCAMSSSLEQVTYPKDLISNTYLESYEGFTFSDTYLKSVKMKPVTSTTITKQNYIEYTNTPGTVLTDLKLTITNSKVTAYIQTNAYKFYKDKIMLRVLAKAIYGDETQTKDIYLYVPLASLGIQAEITVPITLPIFDSVYKNTNPVTYTALSRIVLVPNIVTAVVIEDDTLSEEEIASIVRDLSGLFKATGFSYVIHQPMDYSIFAELTLPSTPPGKIFVKEVHLEYPAQMSLKKYFDGVTKFPYIHGSTPKNKTWDFSRNISIYEISKNNSSYRLASNPENMFSCSDSMIDDELDSSAIYVAQQVGSTSHTSYATGLDYGQLEKVAFGDYFVCSFVCIDSNGDTIRTSVKNINGLIQDGVIIPYGTTKVLVSIAMLNLTDLTTIRFINNPSAITKEDDYN